MAERILRVTKQLLFQARLDTGRQPLPVSSGSRTKADADALFEWKQNLAVGDVGARFPNAAKIRLRCESFLVFQKILSLSPERERYQHHRLLADLDCPRLPQNVDHPHRPPIVPPPLPSSRGSSRSCRGPAIYGEVGKFPPTDMTMPGWLIFPPIDTRTSCGPSNGKLVGIRTLSCITPATMPGASPAYV